jgi:glycosyltransferase involved in cell wall biosynthesis
VRESVHVMLSRVGVVAIGRNEGERLKKCLESVVHSTRAIVYVDSGSSDGSAEMAHAMGVDVLRLDMRSPFTAARARNEGYRRLRKFNPNLAYVQFVDGDCEIIDGWLEEGVAFLDGHADVAVVCGRRRERYPDRSIYNMLCDMEWDRPPGEVKACGGDALMRVAAFDAVAGYRTELIAGEEPELCVRLRRAGWRIWRLEEEMTLHDAAMTRFTQWWKRSKRAGYAFAEGAWLHGAPPERHYLQESRRAWVWGAFLPAGIGFLTLLHPAWLLLAFAYPLQVLRLAIAGRLSMRENWWRALFLVVGRFPEALGQIQFIVNRAWGRQRSLIEYK